MELIIKGEESHNNMDKALDKAIEGNYTLEQRKNSLGILKSVYEMLWDPEFWQALGRAEGWDIEDNNKLETIKKSGGLSMPISMYKWNRQWHTLVEYMSTGKSIDDFFNKLLK